MPPVKELVILRSPCATEQEPIARRALTADNAGLDRYSAAKSFDVISGRLAGFMRFGLIPATSLLLVEHPHHKNFWDCVRLV